jgi:hypothetical protein
LNFVLERKIEQARFYAVPKLSKVAQKLSAVVFELSTAVPKSSAVVPKVSAPP